MKQARRRNDHGFTLTEMLVTVAIVIVLFALAMIPISKMRREVRQTELDSRAEIVFMAAQNQLTQLQAAGRASAYQGGVALGYVPADAEAEKYTDDNPLVYVTNAGENVAGSAAQNILPEDKVDAEIWGANWIIEYDASSASVYAVFYSEQDGVLSSDTRDAMDTLRSRSVRLQQGAKVGYYGGDSVLSYDTSALNAKAEIVNDEQLLLKVTCNRVIAQDGSTPRPTITVTLKDESGNIATVEIPPTKIDTELYTYTGTLVLDDLTEGDNMRFAEQDRFKSLVPGEDLTISVHVAVEDDDLIEPSDVKISEKVNSLFAGVRSNGSGSRTAVIKYGRHLQNLDEASGVNKQTVESRVITAAVQEQDIEFKSIAERGWQTLYGEDMTFKPIQNSKLTSYDSTYSSAADTADTAKYHPVIYDLTVDAKGDAGLFASFGKSSTENELLNIRLAGAKISGTDNVGGLVGKLSGETTIDGCQVYLSRARNHPDGKDETELWLDGSVTGGLIGNASGDVTIKDSFAATVLNGTEAAGGLIGKSGNVTVEHSYADCYVYAVTTKDGKATNAATQNGVAGGLIGSRNATNIVKITDCYAAGFLKAETTAGIAAGEIAGKDNVFTNVYTACASLDGTSLSYIIGKIGGVDEPSIENVYYLSDIANSSESSDTAAADTDPGSKIKYVSYESWSGNNREEAAENKLAKAGQPSAFVAEAKNTYAYNLIEGLGLTQYSYPALNGLDHYGDWQAKFENESLAYYEKYGENSYGFSGGNISTLKTDGTVAVGDGYGLLYATAPAGNVTVSVGNNSYTLNAEDFITITTTVKNETKSYYLLPLPAELVQKMGVGDSFYTKLTVGGTEGKTFYYNPHFASTATSGSDDKAPDAPDRVDVRTARQLNALSKYYSEYFKKDETGIEKSLFNGNTSFVQGTNIDYTSYDWANFGADGEAVTKQQPIGADMAKPFRYSYNGNSYEITGVSFVGKTCAGLFGYNVGALSNIIITTNQPMTNEKGSANTKVPTAKVSATVQLNTVYVGVLAAWNQTGGTISNCAVSGYDLTGYAYSGSTSYVGGLVGFNAGTIRASSAVTPLIKGTGNLVQSLSIGGLVGGNGGQIRQSYAMAAISVMEVSGRVSIAGFAGENVGTIRSSYCATALLSAGADTYGFAPGSGSLNGCYFLNGGTYTFAGKVYLYDYDSDKKVIGAEGVSGADLEKLNLDGFGTIADEAHSVNHPNTVTDGTDGEVCPYPGSVSGHDGALTHYGDWVTEADLGTLGMIYWEKEEGGSNDGYHFSFIGFENGVDRKQDSNLCEAHDDGGKITAYGYGYYWKDTEKEPELKEELAPLERVIDNGTFELGTALRSDRDKDSVAAELAKQVPGYKFVTYQTGTENGTMHLLSSKTANGTWTLTQTDKSGTALAFKFIVNPFFADSYDYVSTKSTSENKTPGSDALPYQVRSVEQLQFINWSYDGTSKTGSVTADVTDSNYRTFPYLLYATQVGAGEQIKDVALEGDGVGGKRTIQSWVQTHDVNGTDLTAATDKTKNAELHPIAGAVNYWNIWTHSDNYAITLYNWFGGKYNGQNYYIKNIRIDSYCYNVGLFGTTAGAKISDIVLYSDNDSIIQRSSKPTSVSSSYPSFVKTDPAEYQTSYALGGLVGIAYDYKTTTEKSVISNCAIAGYTIQDNSKNKLRLGEAVVGGLIGVSNVDLKNCSAVVDIQVNCTHRWGKVNDPGTQYEEGGLNAAKWGNFIRVGGLVGGLRYQAENCYTGGSITVSKETLEEQIKWGNEDNTAFCDGSTSVRVKSAADDNGRDENPATYVFIGGISGSGFSANFINFTGESGSVDGTPKFVNCYTYIDFPKMQGTINGIALIGSGADRFKMVQAEIENCYYLNSSGEVDFSKASKTYIEIDVDRNGKTESVAQKSLYDYFDKNNANQALMLNGSMSYAGSCLWGTWGYDAKRDGLTGLTYEQMSDQIGSANLITTENNANKNDAKVYSTFKEALGSGYDWVSTEENNATIHGKYSFPGSDSELQGQDYPFPTVLTQTDLFGNTVHLHYGRWPKVGMFWKEGIASLDLIADYDQSVKNESAIKTQLVLNNLGKLKLKETDIQNVTFDYGGGAAESDIAKASIVSVVEGRDGTTPAFNVVLKGLSPGAVEITATFTKDGTTYTARMTITVTAELNVVLDPAIVDEYVDDSKDVALKALNCKKTEIENVTWTYVNDDEKIAKVTRKDATLTVEGLSEGETTVHVTATVKLGDKTYTGTNVLSVTVSEPGVLGIANTVDPANQRYYEGTINKTLTDWEDGKSAENKTYSDDAPACEGSTLFLYGRGQKAKLSSFDVTSIKVTGDFKNATSGFTSDTKEVLNGKEQGSYTVTVGSLSASGKDTFLPLSVRGWKQGEIALTVTLTDRRTEAKNATYTLSIPYTLTEADTKVTARFEGLNSEEISGSKVNYGEKASAPEIPNELLEELKKALPENYSFADLTKDEGWEPSLTNPLYVDTVFKPKYEKDSYKITFVNMGAEVVEVTVKKGESVGSASSWPIAPTRDGYKFLGWTTDGVTCYSGTSTFVPTDDTALYALWRKTVTISVSYTAYNGQSQTQKATVSEYSNGGTLSFWYRGKLSNTSVTVKVDDTIVTSFSFGVTNDDRYPSYNYYTITIPRDQFPSDEWN